jgi:glycosyltransferase involved in cell wall biosynthesis
MMMYLACLAKKASTSTCAGDASGVSCVIKTLKERGCKIVHTHLGDGLLINELRRKVEEFGLQGSFLLLGNVTDVSEYLRNSDMLFHAAISEGSPNAIIEAMAEGLVAITSDCGDVSQIVVDGVNGFIVGESDFVNSFCSKVLELENDCEKRRLIGGNARRLIQMEFNTENYFFRARKIYNV